MKLVFFTHPLFLGSQSMPRFAEMLTEGMRKRGHEVAVLSPEARFFKLPVPGVLKKWMGYIDQYAVFPARVRRLLNSYPVDTLFVFTDHALGPWVPLVADRPHVIHCHDFLAQRSAQKEIKENPTAFTGRLYQNFIRKGYSKGKSFIPVSYKTEEDLKRFLSDAPAFCEVVYNGLNRSFESSNVNKARTEFGIAAGLELESGYILHIGGNQWYKNRMGVVEIYESWRRKSSIILPLLMIGKDATPELKAKGKSSKYSKDIHFLTDIRDEQLQMAYSGASLLLFPSLAEGFGWPIAEAMASGCPVVTTNEAPMTEVAGDAGFLIGRRPENPDNLILWADEAAQIVDKIVNLSAVEREAAIKAGVANSKRFETENALNRIEEIYQKIIKASTTRRNCNK